MANENNMQLCGLSTSEKQLKSVKSCQTETEGGSDKHQVKLCEQRHCNAHLNSINSDDVNR